jgi:hypothetical protein
MNRATYVCDASIRHGATEICFSTRLVEACLMVVYISRVMECGQEPGQHPTWGDVSYPLPMPKAWLFSGAPRRCTVTARYGPNRRFLRERRRETITHTNAARRASATMEKMFPRDA